MIDVDAAMAYLRFVEARHEVWWARQHGEPRPWTDEPIVDKYKFTNVFRLLDYGSQFVITDLIDPDLDVRDQLARLFLYRHTGRVEVWQYIELMLGRMPLVYDLPEVLEIMKQYRGEARTRTRKSDPKSAARQTQVDFKRSVFTNAYLVFPQSQVKGTDKLESIINLTTRLFHPDSPEDVVWDFETAQTQQDRFDSLRRNKGVADFMSMQILTDWGYGTNDRENEFIVLGPGATRGAQELDPDAKPMETLRWAYDAIQMLPNPPRLPNGRLPSYMDAQNTLCEFSKHVRYASKPPPNKPYTPAHPGPQPAPVLPQLW